MIGYCRPLELGKMIPRSLRINGEGWYQLMKAFGLSENDETYDSLLAYSEKHRAYHRLEHISACFRHLDIVS